MRRGTVSENPTAALFDRVLEEMAENPEIGQADAVHRAVEAMLAVEFAHLPTPVRAEMVKEIAASLMADPDLSSRLERLLKQG